jgi:arylformamidase
MCSGLSSVVRGLFLKELKLMYILLSYYLTEHTPTFLTNPPVRIHDNLRLAQGDGCNQYVIEILNHSGTHMDTPNHVSDQGPRLAEIPIGALYFTNPLLLDIPRESDQLIQAEDLLPYREQMQGHDLLLLRTGFWRYRSTEPERYRAHNPGLGSTAARFLFEQVHSLRAIGLDIISMAAAQSLADGVQTHHILLNHRPGERYILAIEDMPLGLVTQTLKSVWVVPWLLEQVDSTPVTVIAEIE